jgi:hypothetical protein
VRERTALLAIIRHFCICEARNEPSRKNEDDEMKTSKLVAFACAAALMTFGAATAASARPSDEGATKQIGALDAQKSPSARPDFRLALNPQPLPPGYAPDDEDGRW